MCGITSYVGRRPATDLLLSGLRQLEYRGYDSAGIALLSDSGGIETVHAVGNLVALEAAVADRVTLPARVGAEDVDAADATTGIGHTRWATHGGVTVVNAHPHTDTDERIQIVLNGIIENHSELRRWMSAQGATIRSETDAEVLAHLIAHYDAGDLAAAVASALAHLEGHFAIVAMSADHPGLLVGARRDCPLVVGFAEDGHFIASALPAFLSHTRRMSGLGDGELVVATADTVEFRDIITGRVRAATPVTVDWDHDLAEKGGYDTFMLKEIDEQPEAVGA
ncbi:MAG: glutamine--fructose-6-phosphate transaminase (isomerizing), partial [Acidimicrobiales bacterium]